MLISATELKANIGKYLDTASREDVFVSRKGKIVARISSPANDRFELLDSLVGIASDSGLTPEKARMERLSRK